MQHEIQYKYNKAYIIEKNVQEYNYQPGFKFTKLSTRSSILLSYSQAPLFYYSIKKLLPFTITINKHLPVSY